MNKIKKIHWYIFSMIFVFAFWSFIFGLLDRIPYSKRMDLFIAAHHADEAAIEKQINNLINDQDIEAINIDTCTPGSSETFYSVLSTRGTTYTDIIILPEGTWPNSFCRENVRNFTENEMLTYFPEGNYKYLRYDEAIYGICVYDSETKESLLPETWIDYEADVMDRNYYLFVNASSDTPVFPLLKKLFTQ